jgi:hypothetical protein
MQIIIERLRVVLRYSVFGVYAFPPAQSRSCGICRQPTSMKRTYPAIQLSLGWFNQCVEDDQGFDSGISKPMNILKCHIILYIDNNHENPHKFGKGVCM